MERRKVVPPLTGRLMLLPPNLNYPRILVSIPYLTCEAHNFMLCQMVHDHRLTWYDIISTDPYIPYKATVSARTSVGEGEPSSVVFFTLEGGKDLYLLLYDKTHGI